MAHQPSSDPSGHLVERFSHAGPFLLGAELADRGFDHLQLMVDAGYVDRCMAVGGEAPLELTAAGQQLADTVRNRPTKVWNRPDKRLRPLCRSRSRGFPLARGL